MAELSAEQKLPCDASADYPELSRSLSTARSSLPVVSHTPRLVYVSLENMDGNGV